MVLKKAATAVSRKAIQEEIAKHLSENFKHLEGLLGKKEFAKRVKKAGKLLTRGLKLKETKEATPETAGKETKAPVKAPAKEKLQKSRAKAAADTSKAPAKKQAATKKTS